MVLNEILTEYKRVWTVAEMGVGGGWGEGSGTL